MVRAMIWHSPRTGSNMLCSYINRSGIGISRYIHCGFFIGYGESLAIDTMAKVEHYFREQETPNGVQMCKGSFEYWDDMGKGGVDWRVRNQILESFDKHIFLTRRDELAQAVSWVIAATTKKWSTNSDHAPKEQPVYNRQRLVNIIGKIRAFNARFEAFADYSVAPEDQLHLVYEDILSEDINVTMAKIAELLGI